MELVDVMRTTFAARDYRSDPVSDETLYRILDNARFAPSGGNRQGWRVIVIRDKVRRRQLRELMQPVIKQYKAQAAAGETPFNSVIPSRVTQETINAMPATFPLVDNLENAPVVMVVCVDLTCVTSFDKELDRVGVISGASIYPFVWNLLLAARDEGLGGVLTTFLAAQEPAARKLLRLPEHFAIASMVAIGKPVKQLTRLQRNPVATFARIDSWDGDIFDPQP
ncbi:MAG: nitroreductase family protein [Pseudomonadota bacterium]